MDLAERLNPTHPIDKELRTKELETINIKLVYQLLLIFILAIPFIGLAWLTKDNLYLSNQHAHLVSKALQALERGRFEIIGFTYPPLPFLLTAIYPKPFIPSILAALVSGATAWVLLSHLIQVPINWLSKVTIVFCLILMPASLFISTQALGDISTLFLFLVAWNQFIRFTRGGETWSGFITGLVLGLAFFFNPYALIYGLIYALASPLFYHWENNSLFQRHWQDDLTLVIVIAFPTLLAFFSWSYLNWVFSGNPWRFLSDPASPLFTYMNAEITPIYGIWAAFISSLNDLFHLPLYLGIGLLVLFVAPRRFLAYLAPFFVSILVRSLGMAYPQTFALTIYSVVAIAGIPRRTPKIWGWILIPVALLNLLVTFTTQQNTELRTWEQLLINQKLSISDEFEWKVAQIMTQAPPRSILTDDRSSYRIIARAGTAKPFLLPGDTEFLSALSAPQRYVKYILIPTTGLMGGDQVAAHFGEHDPEGFVLEAIWQGWKLFRKEGAEPLFTKTTFR
ncbi:MAG: hypothetical protein ACPL3P_00700 [Anaerolineales bacterium]